MFKRHNIQSHSVSKSVLVVDGSLVIEPQILETWRRKQTHHIKALKIYLQIFHHLPCIYIYSYINHLKLSFNLHIHNSYTSRIPPPSRMAPWSFPEWSSVSGVRHEIPTSAPDSVAEREWDIRHGPVSVGGLPRKWYRSKSRYISSRMPSNMLATVHEFTSDLNCAV